jgi:hypothetical protein
VPGRSSDSANSPPRPPRTIGPETASPNPAASQ